MSLSEADSCIGKYQKRQKHRQGFLIFFAAVLVALTLCDLTVGSSEMSLNTLMTAVLSGPNGQGADSFIFWEIRFPMTLTCIFVGASLSLAGLLIQTVTNNPLASPYTLGVTAGAAFGATISITLGFAVFGQLWIGTSLSALFMALSVSSLIFYLGNKQTLTATSLILVGVIMNFFFQALQQYLQYRASPEIAQIISGWTFGNLQRSSWISSAISSFCWIFALFLSFRYVWKLTALAEGVERAAGLGINVNRLRVFIFTLSSLLVSSAVAFIGTVGFVGLIAPHCAKLILGEDHRFLIIASSMTGAILMLSASVISKWMSQGATLPVGIVTSVIGVPFLFFLLMRVRE